jgi:hypothetical protein
MQQELNSSILKLYLRIDLDESGSVSIAELQVQNI